MGTIGRTHVIGLALLLSGVFYAIPAAAHVDFQGEWAPRFYEDQLERLPGP